VIGGILIAFSIFMYIQADKLPPAMFGARGADLFPKILFTLMATCGVVLTVEAVIKDRKAKAASAHSAPTRTSGEQIWGRVKETLSYHGYVIFAFLAFFAYVVMMHYLGYPISTLVFMPVLMWVLGPRTKKAALAIAATTLGVTFVIHYSFLKLLRVFLPSGSLF
jgi:hypothetical protein